MSTKKILITGGAGFIGSHLVDAYIAHGYHVAVVDNLLTGQKSNVNKRATFYKIDTRNFNDLIAVFKKERPDTVSHHAGIVQTSILAKGPTSLLQTNIVSTSHVLWCMEKFGTKKIIFSSSAAIYGDAPRIPIKETSEAQPIAAYGISKLTSEELILSHAKWHKINYAIFRYANVYGPRQGGKGEGAVIPKFISLMKHNQRPTIFGDGTKTRDYIYVADLVRANLIATQYRKPLVINISTGKEISDDELFASIAQLMRFKKRAHYGPHRPGDVLRSALSTDKAQKTLGWQSTTGLTEGLAATIAANKL